MAPRKRAASDPSGGWAVPHRTGARESTARRTTYPYIVWPNRAEEPAARPALDPRTAVASRRNVMLATLRSEDPASLAQLIFDEIAIAIVEGRFGLARR